MADEVTQAVRKFYEENNPDALEDPSKRAATTLVAARIIGDELIITQIGDTNVRLTKRDGSREVLTNDKLVDVENAKIRSDYIMLQLETLGHTPTSQELTDIVRGGRDVIQERLNTQYAFQNNTEDTMYGYGIIDGQTIPHEFPDGTPTGFVKVFQFSAADIAKIELVSDGFYGAFPETSTEEDYQALFNQIHKSDPNKYLRYLSTKSRDDATVVIADIN